MHEPILIDKPLGATPLQALALLRGVRSELAGVKLAYAGRLDPMATGLLPVLWGNLLFRQEEFWHLDKEYEATVALGVATDSYDVLGLPGIAAQVAIGTEHIHAAAHGLVGKIYLSVPVFSSYRAAGKPMFAWARQGLPQNIAVPVRKMAVQEVAVCDVGQVTLGEVAEAACGHIMLVDGDFRQAESIREWEVLADTHGTTPVTLVRLRIQCASGTYIRSLARELGRRLGTGGIVTALRRTRVGSWRVDDPTTLRLSWPQ